MCGIAGIIQADDRPFESGLLETMTSSLLHRGPDGEGYVLLDARDREKPFAVRGSLRKAVGNQPGRFDIGLGHRRLAILDLTPLGHQPMGTADGRFWITYNGEVYNAPELRRELSGVGAEFRSGTDTEVVLEAYRRWGRACLDRFNGMFAFAIWDARAHQLFCARDRFGIKPFYFRQAGARFLFASEIKALRCDPGYTVRPNDRVVYDYLTQGLHDHSTDTFYDGVRQLAPGEWLGVQIEESRGGKRSLSLAHDRWYHLPNRTQAVSAEEAAPALRDLLQDSVRLELRADVPVGSCLSGGLDSSSIVCLMSRLLPRGAPSLQTFSSCHADPRYDERAYIQLVVAETGVVNHQVVPDPIALYGDLPAVLRHQEEPLAGTSVLAQWAVMRAAGEAGVKVLLDGQGADEILLGYPGYMGSRLADLIRNGRWLEGLREWRAWRRIHGSFHRTAAANFARGLFPANPIRRLRARMTGERQWLAATFASRVNAPTFSRPEPRAFRHTVLDEHSRRSITQDLPALLHYEDRNAMAFSVEARVPFLDHRIVELLLTLPAEDKLHRGMTKVVLREAMDGVLPARIRSRTDKMGFVTPEDSWLRVAWRPQIETLLASGSMRQRPYWKAPVLKEWYRRYCEGRLAAGPVIWRWMNVELWLRAYCD